jgi:ABC-type Na+ efflux pump permease subunit
VMRDWGLLGVELSSVILIFTGFIFSFYREKNSRIQEVYFTNMSRSAYISGKILAFVVISFFYLVLSAVALSSALFYFKAFHLAVLLAFYPLFLKLIILSGIVCLTCYVFTSASVALFISFCIYFLCMFAPSTFNIVNAFGEPLQKAIIGTIYFVLPNMDKLDIRYLAAWGNYPSFRFVVDITIYAGVYFVFLWLVNIYLFRRK